MIVTLWPRQNGCQFADDTFKRIVFNGNVWILKFVRKSPIDNIPALVKIMAWCRQDDKPISEPMMVSLATHIYVIQPQWVMLWLYHNDSYRHVWYRWINCNSFSHYKPFSEGNPSVAGGVPSQRTSNTEYFARTMWLFYELYHHCICLLRLILDSEPANVQYNVLLIKALFFSFRSLMYYITQPWIIRHYQGTKRFKATPFMMRSHGYIMYQECYVRSRAPIQYKDDILPV